MTQREYTLRFLTPAFLGDASGAGAWRSPPFKALLRQWWRVAVAADVRFDVQRLREQERALFGSADEVSSKSLVRIRLDSWRSGTQKEAPRFGSVTIGRNSIPASFYAGYGPIIAGPRLKSNAAIQQGEWTKLRIAYPENCALDYTLGLIQRFGTLGGRSRNGWGSIELQGSVMLGDLPLLDWREAMQRDWAHCIGKDEQGALIWRSKPVSRWEDAMHLLAQLRADMRRKVSDRLLLAFPSTKGNMHGWTSADRVPHSLRFKVCASDNHYQATVFHVPCRPADNLWTRLPVAKQRELSGCFEQAHRFLDNHSSLEPRK